jgi:hypothetical protein
VLALVDHLELDAVEPVHAQSALLVVPEHEASGRIDGWTQTAGSSAASPAWRTGVVSTVAATETTRSCLR